MSAAVTRMPVREMDRNYVLLVLTWLASYVHYGSAVEFLRGVPLEASPAHHLLQGIRASEIHMNFVSQQFQASWPGFGKDLDDTVLVSGPFRTYA